MSVENYLLNPLLTTAKCCTERKIMPEFNVEIKATVRKTYKVTAENAEAAEVEANGVFSVLNDDIEEDYDQETLSVVEVK
jgi:preprotein translocase subunit SecB